MDYDTIIKNENKIVEIEKDSADSWRLGDIIGALGNKIINNEKSDFTWRNGQQGGVQIIEGRVVFKNGCEVLIV